MHLCWRVKNIIKCRSEKQKENKRKLERKYEDNEKELRKR